MEKLMEEALEPNEDGVFDLDLIEEGGSDSKRDVAVLAVGAAAGVVGTLIFPRIIKGVKWSVQKVKMGVQKVFKKEENIDVKPEE